MIRSGRQRNADFNKSSKVTDALKVSVWHSTARTFGFWMRSSEVSSMMTMRSCSGIAWPRILSSVVFPVLRSEGIGLAFDGENIRLLDAKLGGVFNDDDALMLWDCLAKDIEQCRLPGPQI